MKNNKLIAEFMELPTETMGVNATIVYGINQDDWYTADNLNYSKSWDWLMPVIDKIGDNFTSTTIEMLAEYYYKDGDNQDGLNDIKEFYEAVVFWIKENNNNYKT